MLIKLHLANLSISEKIVMRDKWFSRPTFVTIYRAKDRKRRPRASFNWRSQFVPLCDYRATRRPITHKRRRRNREITVGRGSLAVSSIPCTVEFPLPNKTWNFTWNANHTRNDRLRGTDTTKRRVCIMHSATSANFRTFRGKTCQI